VSRISSPASTAKSLESTFIAALKRYFELHSRIIRVNDYFALAIDETITHFPPTDDPPDRQTPNTIAWYRVEKVTISSSPTGSKEFDGDVYVDTASTKMLQSFYASSTIPLKSMALHSYLGIPHLPISDEEALSRSKGFSRLRALSEAMLSPLGRKANLSMLSVLVHGQRGVGKKTVAEWVATTLGLHFFEVNCYDILSESESKTEAYLRHRIDRANSYRPCLLLLRHIDAFAKKRDVLQQGQDPAIRFVLVDCLAQVQKDGAGKEWPLIVVGTTSERDKCSEGVAGIFKHEIEINVILMRLCLITGALRNGQTRYTENINSAIAINA
jgi:peroxin-6